MRDGHYHSLRIENYGGNYQRWLLPAILATGKQPPEAFFEYVLKRNWQTRLSKFSWLKEDEALSVSCEVNLEDNVYTHAQVGALVYLFTERGFWELDELR